MSKRFARSWMTTAVAAVGLVLPMVASGQTTSPAKAVVKPATPPAYTPLRWNEDYSYLKDPSKRLDALDNLKYIPLGGDDIYLSLGGQVRERYENYNNLNFGAGAQDNDGYFLTRVLAHADLHVGENLRFFVQGKSAVEDGRTPEPRASDRDEAELQQAFVDFILPFSDTLKTTARLGRQELLFGRERLLGCSDWTNVRRNFEGARVTTEYKSGSYGNTLDLLLLRPTVTHVEGYNDGDDSQTLWGVYDTVSLPNLIAKADSKVELYFLTLNQTQSSTRGFDADFYTVGSRFTSKPKPFDIDIEGAYQFGDRGGLDVSSWFVAAEFGMTLPGVPLTPRPFVGFDYATGDDNPGDGDFNTFNTLFATQHMTNGYVDAFERPNVLSPTLGVDLLLLEKKSWAKKVNLRAQYLAFWRADTDTGLFSGTGSSARADGGSEDSFIGHEVDLYLTWQYDRHTMFIAGYSHFFAADFINTSGAANQDIDFLYFGAQFTF